MAFVNPWAYYDPKDSVLAPNYHSYTPSFYTKDEEQGYLGTFCGFAIATIIVAPLFYLCFTHIKGTLWLFLILMGITVTYPILIILLVKLSIKTENKMRRNRKKIFRKIKRFFFPSKRDEIVVKIRNVQLLKAEYREEYKWTDDTLHIRGLWSEDLFDRRDELLRLIKRCDFAIKSLKEEWKQMGFK